jgi:hypothetical protein
MMEWKGVEDTGGALLEGSDVRFNIWDVLSG